MAKASHNVWSRDCKGGHRHWLCGQLALVTFFAAQIIAMRSALVDQALEVQHIREPTWLAGACGGVHTALIEHIFIRFVADEQRNRNGLLIDIDASQPDASRSAQSFHRLAEKPLKLGLREATLDTGIAPTLLVKINQQIQATLLLLSSLGNG